MYGGRYCFHRHVSLILSSGGVVCPRRGCRGSGRAQGVSHLSQGPPIFQKMGEPTPSPTPDTGIRSMCGRYASYGNSFLFTYANFGGKRATADKQICSDLCVNHHRSTCRRWPENPAPLRNATSNLANYRI